MSYRRYISHATGSPDPPMSISSHNPLTEAATIASPLVVTSTGMSPCVIEVTERLFGGPVSIRVEDDPEFPSRYFVVSTPASGEVEELVAKVNDWHRTIREVLGDGISDYRLMIEPR